MGNVQTTTVTQISSSTTPVPKGPGLVGSKRSRRIRSSGSCTDVKQIKKGRKAPGGAKKGKETAIFLRKTYDMITKCDESLASWTKEGDMFIIKDSESFARTVIPQYFDHNKFSSFNRQLNFYGFRKLQTEPILKSDIDKKTLKWITFHHKDFKRGRLDLLSNIKRSTRKDGNNAFKDQQKEIANLNERVQSLEGTVQKLCHFLNLEIELPTPTMPVLQDNEARKTVSILTESHVEYEMNRKKSPADAKLEKMASLRGIKEERPTLLPHPKAKGHLPGEVNLPGGLERGISQISLLRGLSSDPIWLQSGTSTSLMEERFPAE